MNAAFKFFKGQTNGKLAALGYITLDLDGTLVGIGDRRPDFFGVSCGGNWRGIPPNVLNPEKFTQNQAPYYS